MKSQLINIKGQLYDLSKPVVMGILNITPDSYFATSRKMEIPDILKRVEHMLADGAFMIDIGAQSTRPSSELISAKEEIARLKPALDAINKEFPNVILSVDTFYSEVARFCVEEHGVAIINDISGGDLDAEMFNTVAKLNVPYVLMHMKGTPQTMQKQTVYGNLLEDVCLHLSSKVKELNLLGVNDIILDPGFGFAKNVEQNYELMSSLKFFENFDLPLLVGISRKSMITKFLDVDTLDALNATTVLNTFALLNGANILRVHDVKEAVEAVKIVQKLNSFSETK